MSDVLVVSGTRRAMKEMADGTIRVSIDVDPTHRAAFLKLFPNIDMPVALAPLVNDFERREPKPDDYGQHYACLYKAGWFHNPKVIAALGVHMGLIPDERIEAIKRLVYEYFNVDSLAKIPPNSFIGYCIEAGIRATLPAAFGGAA